MRARIILILGVLAAATTGCAIRGSERADVVAGFYPLAWAAQEIGPRLHVVDLTPTGGEPHDLEPTARDVERIREAKLVLYIRGFQPAVDHALAGRDGPSIDMKAGLSSADPHVWLDPVRFAAEARTIGRALGRPEAGDRLARRLTALDREFRAGLADCRRREIVTSHAAFGYLAARYGLRQVSLAGLSPEAEPTPRALRRLVETVRSTGATTVFTEPLVSPRIAQTVARETGARTAVLDPVEGLTPSERARADDYVSIMRRNLGMLRRALSCR